MSEKQYYVGLDIGTTNIVMVVGSRSSKDGMVKIESLSSVPSKKSVFGGVASNPGVFRVAVNTAKSELEQMLKVKIEQTYIGIGNSDTRGVIVEDFVPVKNKRTGIIAKEDISLLEQLIRKVRLADRREMVLDIRPICYYINGTRRVLNPIGEQGSYVKGRYLVTISGSTHISMLKSLKNAIGLADQAFFANATISPSLLVSPAEAQQGVVVVDIGGGLTDITVVHEGRVQAFVSLAIGSETIDTDLQTILRHNSNITSLKHKYGCAIANNIPTNQVLSVGGKDVIHRNVATVIEARLMDIVELVVNTVNDMGFADKIERGYVLTGGATHLADIATLFERETLRPCRCADHLYNVEMPDGEFEVTYGQQMAVAVMLEGSKLASSSVIAVEQLGTAVDKKSEIEGTEGSENVVAEPLPDITPATTPEVKLPQQPLIEPKQKSDKPKDEAPKEKPNKPKTSRFARLLTSLMGGGSDSNNGGSQG